MFQFDKKNNIGRALFARGAEQEELFCRARQARDAVFQHRVEVRSVMEYANLCRQACRYCGMNRNSGVKRFVLDNDTALERIQRVYDKGRRVFMIQSGEFDSENYFAKICALLKQVKGNFKDLTVICSLGSLSSDRYKKLRDIGIERYLLKFETSDPELYRQIKPADSLRNRLAHIAILKKLGFQISSGNITGLPGQTIESLANDLLLLKSLDIPMGSTSVFIPNDISDYGGYPAGNVETALNFMAILRIMNPAMLIPTTSSLELLKKNGQYWGLVAGANAVTAHDSTPREDEDKFVIYKKGRYRPKDILFKTVAKAGLKPAPASLIRGNPQDSLFYKLIRANMKHNQTAVYSENISYTYRDIYNLTSKFCAFLTKQDIQEGDVVLLAMPDSVELVAALLSCLRLGIVAGLADPLLNKDEWGCVLSEISPKKIFNEEGVRNALNSERIVKNVNDFSPDKNNPAIILFTSGSMGRPKGVVHSYGDLWVDAFSRDILKISNKDIIFSYSRMHTSYGLGNSFLFPFHFGAKVILSRGIPNPFSLRKILKFKPTLFFAVPSVYESLLAHGDSLRGFLKTVRLFVASGEKLYADAAERWELIYHKRLLECFGSTEMCHPFISNLPGKERPNSCGKVLRGFAVKFSKSGRIFCQGPPLFSGYWNDFKLTHRRLRNGWFKSDDVGYMDDRGYVFIRGRENMVFKINGQWCSILDVEDKLRKCSIIKEVAVIKGRKGLDYFVSLKNNADNSKAERIIREYCVKVLPLFELPRNIWILKSLPRLGSGKINRRLLKLGNKF